jgi:hypothetical protein
MTIDPKRPGHVVRDDDAMAAHLEALRKLLATVLLHRKQDRAERLTRQIGELEDRTARAANAEAVRRGGGKLLIT